MIKIQQMEVTLLSNLVLIKKLTIGRKRLTFKNLKNSISSKRDNKIVKQTNISKTLVKTLKYPFIK